MVNGAGAAAMDTTQDDATASGREETPGQVASADEKRFEVTEEDRVEARKYLRYLIDLKLGAKRKHVSISEDLQAQMCATRKANLISYIVANGGDGNQCAIDITVTVVQRKGGNTAGDVDYYYHDLSGKRYRSNKEVAKKLFGLNVLTSTAKKRKQSVDSLASPKAPPLPQPPSPASILVADTAAVSTPPS